MVSAKMGFALVARESCNEGKRGATRPPSGAISPPPIDDLISDEDRDYILEECQKVADRIIKGIPGTSLEEIIEKHR